MYTKPISLLLGAVLAAVASASSALIVTTGIVPQDDSALVRNPCGLSDPDVGTSVLGCLVDFLSQTISISSDEILEISGGLAILDATDGTFSQLTLSATAPASLRTVILNIDATEDGFVTFTDASGTSAPFALDDNGSNFFTGTDITGNFLSAVSLNGLGSETDIFDSVTQIRLGVVGVVGAIPEPGTLVLLLTGLTLLIARLHRSAWARPQAGVRPMTGAGSPLRSRGWDSRSRPGADHQ